MSQPFVDWNAELLRNFFSPANAGERVFLAASREELDDIAPHLGGYNGLLAAVRRGPPWPCGRGVVKWAENLALQRTSLEHRPPGYVSPEVVMPDGTPHDRAPTYFPILAALVAMYVEHPQERGGFYVWSAERLPALGWTTPTGPGMLAQINNLWSDLEAWTNETERCFGHFVRDQLGAQPNVGTLRAQGIFRASDAERLGHVFRALELPRLTRVEEDRMPSVIESIREEHRLSTGLREAAADPNYQPVIFERIQDLSEEWNGAAPRPNAVQANAGDGAAEQHSAGSLDTTLGLTLKLTNDRLPWIMEWRVSISRSDGTLELVHGERRWQAMLRGEPEVNASCVHDSVSAELLETARLADGGRLAFQSFLDELPGPKFQFEHRPLRYLVFNGATRALVERQALPMHGPAYILSAPGQHNPAVDRLLGEYVATQIVSTDGLPDNWRLLHLPDCSQAIGLVLPDGQPAGARPPPFRLLGGVTIRRGGRMLYLPYDLPQVEVDSTPEARLQAPGLAFHRLDSSGDTATALPLDGPALVPASLVRHRIEITEPLQRFTIRLVAVDGTVLHQRTLRVAASEAPMGKDARPMGLDRWGSSTALQPFLRGLSLSPTTHEPHIPDFDGPADSLGDPPPGADWFHSHPVLRFLDTLAMRDASMIPYGTARDRMRRYLDEAGVVAKLRDVFRDLRRRGFVEVVTDARGRWEGIAKVPPTVWPLAFTRGRAAAWGVTGTLTIQQWVTVCSLGMQSFIRRGHGHTAPAIRLVGELDGELEAVGIRTAPTAYLAIARFSAGLAEYTERFADGYAQLDARVCGSTAVFSPNDASWNVRAPSVVNTPEWTLLRYTDPDTGAHTLRSLQRSTGGGPSYRPVRDERWGIWIAYDATARFYDEQLRQHDPNHQPIAPWPIHYHPTKRQLWLPRRMAMPYVLERALIAASGEPPWEVKLTRDREEPEGFWARTELGTQVGPIDRTFESFVPVQTTNHWLCYPLVPAELAELVAAKLGCRVTRLY